ncbi:MAG: PAS domain S-box protein [Opitutaceae bacterium]|nr:PAS domain S-box protein [Opitutaceae bacterium]
MNALLPSIATPSPPRDANRWQVAACLACASVAGGSAVFGLMVWRAPGETTPVLAAVAAFFLALTLGAFLLWRRQSYAALERELAAERQRKASEQYIERLNRLYAALSQINQTIVRTQERKELFGAICRILVELGGFKMAWIGWRDAATEIIAPVASFGDTGGYLQEVRIYADDRPEGRSPTSMALCEGRTYGCHDLLDDPNTATWRENAARHGFLASIALPIRTSGEVVGALTVYAAEPGVLGEKEITLLEEAAENISFALKNLEHEVLRQQTEAALKLFRKLVDRTNDTLEVIDPETARILDVNEKGCADHGYTREEYLNLRVFDIDPGVGEPMFARGMEELRKSGVMVWESLHRRKDGTSFPVEVNLSFVRSERDYVVAVVRDITARKHHEEQLALLNTALLVTPDCVVITDEHGAIEWVNPAFFKTSGYSFAEAVGQNPRILKSGRQTAEYYAEMWRTITSGQSWHGEFVNRRKDGGLYTEDATIAPVRDATGAIRHFVGVKHDITDRKESERRLREQAELLDKANEAILVADLGHRITFWNRGAAQLFGWTAAEMIGKPVTEVFALGGGASGAEAHPVLAVIGDWRGEIFGYNRNGDPLIIETSITVIRDEAGRPTGRLSISTDITEKKKLAENFLRVQRLESIGMLAAGIAHDLNNVLAPIGMTSALLRNRVSESADLRLLDTLEKCADRGARLVRQILGFVHGTGGEPRLTQVKHLLRDVTDVITATFPKSIVLDEDIPSDLWPVMANPTQIHQVLLNLCVNARDAMPRGGTLRLRGENYVLDSEAAHAIKAAKPGTWLVLQVEDTGTGMPPDVLARMWEPFFTTKSAEKGTGLGLSTVRGIVETHRGFITVRTEPGRGTTFRVYLPAAESAVAASALAIAPRASRGHGELILFVDDEPLIRDAASAILTNAGYRLVTARDGAEAAALFEARPAEFALVITDSGMPILDGGGLSAIIRARNPAMKILAISGLRDSSLGRDGRCGDFADAFVPKPFTAETLLNSVEQLLHGKPTPTQTPAQPWPAF